MRIPWVPLLEVGVAAAHVHGAWTLWPNRVAIQERILPTDKFGHAYPLATVVGMCAWLAAYAVALVVVALVRRRTGRVGAALEALWLAVPTSLFLSFWLGGYRWTEGRSPMVQSGALAIFWAPGELELVWLLAHPLLVALLVRRALRSRPSSRPSSE